MNCWHCERPAVGVCKFCGRGLCKDHVKPRSFILSAFSDSDGKLKAIAVKDTLWCGVCEPQPDPVELPKP